MHEVFVSVIIPVYNVKKYINQCLDSIINQTLRNIEIILIDDCSTDGTGEILDGYAKYDNRIKVVHMANHRNAGVARNVGIKMASGEYLSFLDADDFFALDLLERIYWECKSHSLDMCVYDYVLYDDKNQKLGTRIQLSEEDDELVRDKVVSLELLGDKMLSLWSCALWTRMIRRELVIENELVCQEIHNANDAFFSYAVLASAKRVKYITYQNPLMFYRINTIGQLSNNRSKSPYCIYEALEEIVKFFQNNYAKYMQEDFYHCIIMHILNSIQSIEGEQFKELVLFYKQEGLKKLGLIDAVRNNCIKEWEYKYLFKIINYIDEDIEFILEESEDAVFQNPFKTLALKEYFGNKRVVLWGAGELGSLFANVCKKNQMSLYKVVDKDHLKQGGFLFANEIVSVEEGIKDADIILVTNTRWLDSILDELKMLEFRGEIIDLYSYYQNKLNLEEYVTDLKY